MKNNNAKRVSLGILMGALALTPLLADDAAMPAKTYAAGAVIENNAVKKIPVSVLAKILGEEVDSSSPAAMVAITNPALGLRLADLLKLEADIDTVQGEIDYRRNRQDDMLERSKSNRATKQMVGDAEIVIEFILQPRLDTLMAQKTIMLDEIRILVATEFAETLNKMIPTLNLSGVNTGAGKAPAPAAVSAPAAVAAPAASVVAPAESVKSEPAAVAPAAVAPAPVPAEEEDAPAPNYVYDSRVRPVYEYLLSGDAKRKYAVWKNNPQKTFRTLEEFDVYASKLYLYTWDKLEDMENRYALWFIGDAGNYLQFEKPQATR